VVHLAEHYEKKHVRVTGGVGFKWISKRVWGELQNFIGSTRKYIGHDSAHDVRLFLLRPELPKVSVNRVCVDFVHKQTRREHFQSLVNAGFFDMEWIMLDLTNNEVQQRVENVVLCIQNVPLQGFSSVPATSV
jgi:hypothetical protein